MRWYFIFYKALRVRRNSDWLIEIQCDDWDFHWLVLIPDGSRSLLMEWVIQCSILDSRNLNQNGDKVSFAATDLEKASSRTTIGNNSNWEFRGQNRPQCKVSRRTLQEVIVVAISVGAKRSNIALSSVSCYCRSNRSLASTPTPCDSPRSSVPEMRFTMSTGCSFR